MALIKHRPKLRLKVPRDIRPGMRCRVEVTVAARREVPIDYLAISFKGVERTVFGSGKQRRTYTNTVCALRAQLAGAGTVPAGTHSFPCELPIPSDIPPSYGHAHTSTSVEYEATVHASIPWWPDAKEVFALSVLAPGVELPDSEQPVLFASNAGGPSSTEPYIEGSLAARSYYPGEVIEGVVSVFNTPYNPYRALELTLVGQELIRRRLNASWTRQEGERWTLRMPIEHLEEGMSVAFRMRTHGGITPGFDGGLVSLKWWFEVRAKNSVLKPDPVANIPVFILPAPEGGPARQRRFHAPPSVGSDRMSEVWQYVAGQTGLQFDGRAMSGQLGEALLQIRREHRGPDGIFLVGEIRYPSLSLSLDGGLASGFRRLMGGGVSVGDLAWDRVHYLTGREAAQVQSLARGLSPCLTALQMADIDDEHMVVETRDSGMRLKPLSRFVTQTVALARQLPAGRAAIVAPASLQGAMPAWSRLASRIEEGVLFKARPSVTGRVAGAPVEVFVDWTPEGEVRRTALRVATGAPVDAEDRFMWEHGEPEPASLSRLSREGRALAEALVAGSMGLSVSENELMLSLEGAIEDPLAAIPLLHQLARLAAALRGEGGPYR